MSALTIISNRQSRAVIYWHDLTASERADFDYIDTAERQESATFARYRGAAYDLGEFMRCDGNSDFAAWDGYAGDSYFSGVLIKLDRDGDGVTFGRYVS